jgi:hypothetical protein
MVSLPQTRPSKRVPRAHLEGNTPAVLRFPVDGNDMKPVNQQFCWTRSYTISLIMRKSDFISKCQSVPTPGTMGYVFWQGKAGRCLLE